MVQVKVNEGLLEGELVSNEYGGTYCSFKGIPYARPPLGDLRFKAPQPIKPWQGLRSAKEFGPVCFQYNSLNPNLTNMSEDCLYLNVYTPNTKPKEPLPVMVWIHGGGFVWGSGNDDFYGPDFLVRHGIVLVTINYRLDVLGFLCLDTPDIPGNAGMKDQVAALRWVKKNITYFGGNSENVTIFGESAGAGSVAYHLISPMTKGLFKRAITQSGAATCFWAEYFQPRQKAIILAKLLGFHSEDDGELYEFYKKQPPESLINLKLQVSASQKSYEINFGIANEKDYGQERFFYGDTIDVMQNKTHEGVNIMTGYTQDEGLIPIAIGDTLEENIRKANFYRDFFAPKLILTHCITRDQFEASSKIHKFYFPNGFISMQNSDQLMKFLSTDMFIHGIVLSAKIQSKKNIVYFYKFTCNSERNFFSSLFGVGDLNKDKTRVCHADDLAYLFPIDLVKEKRVDKDTETFKLIERITTLWTNFAKYGNPTPDDSLEVKWNPYILEKQEYLNIGNKLHMEEFPEKEEMELWDDVFREFLPKYTA